MFNFREIFRIGVFNEEDDYSNSYTGGSAGINLNLQIEYTTDSRYLINTFVESISTGSVVNYGLLSILIQFFSDGTPEFARSVQFDPPSSTYPVTQFVIELDKYANLSCSGTIEMSLEAGGVPINDTLNYQLSFIVPLGLGDFSNYDLLVDFLVPSHFLLYIIVPVILIWIFKPIFGLRFTEEDLERDRKFLEYLKKPPKRGSKKSED